MNECIINGKNICPHTELSGKLCSACKEPDKVRLKAEYRNFFCENVPCFMNLDEEDQENLVNDSLECHINAMKNVPDFNLLPTKDQKIMILESLEDLC